MQGQARYIKSFSHGHITIPKEVRDQMGIGEDFWLKIYTDSGKIIAEPIEPEVKKTKQEFQETLLSLPIIDISEQEIKRNRKQIEKRLRAAAR